MDSQPEGFKINIGPVEIKHTPASVNKHIITFGEIGERLLILKKYKIDSDKTVRDLHFLLKDLESHETVEIEEIKNLGNKIVIAELAVESQGEQLPESQLPERIFDR